MESTGGTSWAMSSRGVTSCVPRSCTFGPTDSSPCRTGAGAGTYYASFLIDGTGNTLIDTRTTAEVACASIGRLPQVAHWVRE